MLYRINTKIIFYFFQNYFDFIIIGKSNFELTETPKFVFVAGKTIGNKSTELSNKISKFGIFEIIFSGIFFFEIVTFPELLISKEIVTVSFNGFLIITLDKSIFSNR